MPLTEPPVNQLGRWLTIKEFCAIYSTNKGDVRNAIHRGILTAIRPLGGRRLSVLDPGWVAVLAMFNDPRHLWYLHCLKWQEAMRLCGLRHKLSFIGWVKRYGVEAKTGENGIGQYYALIDIIRMVRKRDAKRYGNNYGKLPADKFSPTMVQWGLNEMRTIFPDTPLTAEEREKARGPLTEKQIARLAARAEQMREQGRKAGQAQAQSRSESSATPDSDSPAC